MTLDDIPIGHVQKLAFLQKFDEIGFAADELRDTLTEINNPTLRKHADTLYDGLNIVLQKQKTDISSSAGLINNIVELLSAVRRLEIPADDLELGRTPSLRRLRSAKGLIAAALIDALEAARMLGIRPREPYIEESDQLEVSKIDNARLLRGLSKRLDAVLEKLNIIDELRDASKEFRQEDKLISFFVGSMKVELNLASMQLNINERTVDLAAFVRTVDIMSELTVDFVTTARAWVGRISTQLMASAEDIRLRVRRVAQGARSSIRWVKRAIAAKSTTLQDFSILDEQKVPEDGYGKMVNDKNQDNETPHPSGMLTTTFKSTLDRALILASVRRHTHATPEHLLLALCDDLDAANILHACGVNPSNLKRDLTEFLDKNLAILVSEKIGGPQPTTEFQRVVQKAAIHVHASGGHELTGANALVALFSERNSPAVQFLNTYNVSRLDAVNFVSHGIPKFSNYRNLYFAQYFDIFRRILSGEVIEQSVRRSVAQIRDTPAPVLLILSKDLDADVRAEVAANRSTPVEALFALRQDPDQHVRSQAMR